MFRRLLSPWRPAAYHGFRKTKDFFEGWYYKNVTSGGARACAVIPGVSLAHDPAASHAFVQFADAARGRAHYFRYPLSEWIAHPTKFDFRIGPNEFRLDRVKLDLADGPVSVQGELTFRGMVSWPVRLFSPGVMGWYALVPTMECYHGVLSFDHRIDGTLTMDGEMVDFNGGKGYIEKDWGASFPEAWIWFQTNHFDEDGVSLFGSIAKIPWRGRFFTGFLFGLWRRNRLYRFATYTGARVRRLDVDAERIFFEVEDRRFILEIRADRREGFDLPAPLLGSMISKVNESLQAHVGVALFDKKDGPSRPVFRGLGRNAGLEFIGDIDVLLAGLKK